MTPDYKITVDEQDITERVRNHLQSLTIEDNAGLESDSLTLVITDSDWGINIPRLGAKISVALGYKGTPLVWMGLFIADTPEYSIAPNVLMIKARAADFYNSSLEKSRVTKSWDETTLGAVVRDVATAMKLEAAVAKELDSILISHIDQTDESNSHFLTRLAKKYGATSKPNGGKLVFAKTGTGKSTSGTALPSITLSLSDIAPGARWSRSGRQQYDGVSANWHNTDEGTTEVATVGGENRKKLQGKFATQAEAEAAAQAEQERLQRENETFEMTLKSGDPRVKAEIEVFTDSTFRKSELIGRWTVRQATHFLSRQGYKTTLTLSK